MTPRNEALVELGQQLQRTGALFLELSSPAASTHKRASMDDEPVRTVAIRAGGGLPERQQAHRGAARQRKGEIRKIELGNRVLSRWRCWCSCRWQHGACRNGPHGGIRDRAEPRTNPTPWARGDEIRTHHEHHPTVVAAGSVAPRATARVHELSTTTWDAIPSPVSKGHYPQRNRPILGVVRSVSSPTSPTGLRHIHHVGL